MIDRKHLLAYTKGVTQNFGASEAHEIFTQFMCRCLPLIEQFLPEVGRSALGTARAYWLEGTGTPEGLSEARIRCWKYLDEKGRGSNIKDQEDAAMRAVICALYAEPESDDFWTDSVEWFANMLDRLGDYSSEVAKLMKA